jgi:hypothetical protein
MTERLKIQERHFGKQACFTDIIGYTYSKVEKYVSASNN